MNDDQIYQNGGTERDIKEYAESNGADLTKEDFNPMPKWQEQFDDLENRGQLFNGTDSISRAEAKNLTKEIIEKLIDEIPDNGIITDQSLFARRTTTTDNLKGKLRSKWLS